MYRKYKRYARKYGKKIYRKAIHPYVNKKKGYANRMKLYKEVQAIKKMVNAEKKTAEDSKTGIGVAQLANGSDGIYVSSITPVIPQGSGFGNRTGRSIKCSGLFFRGQFDAQTNQVNEIKYSLMLVTVKGNTQSTTDIANNMFNVDSLSGIRDYFCSRNPDHYGDFRILAARNYTLRPDQITGQTTKVNFMMPLKLRHHIRYNQNTNNITEGEIYIIIRASDGDSGTPSTGAFFQCSYRLTYYDN